MTSAVVHNDAIAYSILPPKIKVGIWGWWEESLIGEKEEIAFALLY